MIKAFLSHSSADKDRYVRIVAERLGLENCVYDEYTFEFGLKPIEEIVAGLNDSQLFVIFLSEQALSSKWVKEEILQAHELLQDDKLTRIFPIIIDPQVTHLDERIPQWMKDEYNLKFVSRPTVAVRRIRQRLREIAWLQNPRLKELNEIFVGRNDLISTIEQRVDSFDLELPVCFIASGIPHIGRFSLLKHGFVKSNIIRASYDFPSILLRREESLEDFIIKIYDMGFSNIDYPGNLMTMDSGKRIDIAENLIRDIQTAKEIILIRDESCIINYTCEIQPWFDELMHRIASTQIPTFIISSRYRPRADHIRSRPHIFSVVVPELNFNERGGLLKRYTEFEKMVLTREDLAFFVGLQHGYPDQVRFTADLLRDLGINGAKKESHQVTEYNSEKAAILLSKYNSNPEILDFLFLLSDFEFISLGFLDSLQIEFDYISIIEEFIASCICDYVGIEKEFIRLNDTVRDYLRRNRIELPEKYSNKLMKHLEEFLADPNEQDRDVSDISYSIKSGIKEGASVPERYLIPSHFLKSMRELYQEKGNLDRVIELADILLQKTHLLDKKVEQDIRYYLCLSLARKRDSRLLKEVQSINGPEHDFLLGFYYRLQGRAKDAIDRLSSCLNTPSVASRAKRELVQVLLSIEEYAQASTLAESNYKENKSNPFHIQAYFNTLINSSLATAEDHKILRKLIGELESIGSETSDQMANIAKAEFVAKCEKNYVRAKDILDDTINKYPDNFYPLISKAYLAAKNKDIESLRSCYKNLKSISRHRTFSEDTLTRLECYLLALEGNLDKAISCAEQNLKRCPDESRLSFIQRLQNINKPNDAQQTA